MGRVYFVAFILFYGNNVDSDRMLLMSDMRLHCMPLIRLWVSKLEWVNCKIRHEHSLIWLSFKYFY